MAIPTTEVIDNLAAKHSPGPANPFGTRPGPSSGQCPTLENLLTRSETALRLGEGNQTGGTEQILAGPCACHDLGSERDHELGKSGLFHRLLHKGDGPAADARPGLVRERAQCAE